MAVDRAQDQVNGGSFKALTLDSRQEHLFVDVLPANNKPSYVVRCFLDSRVFERVKRSRYAEEVRVRTSGGTAADEPKLVSCFVQTTIFGSAVRATEDPSRPF